MVLKFSRSRNNSCFIEEFIEFLLAMVHFVTFARLFGFVAKKQSGGNDNTCHLFAEQDPGQPASVIVNFVTKVMIGQGKKD